MTRWWDVVKLRMGHLEYLIRQFTSFHNTSLARNYISKKDKSLAEQLFQKIINMLNDPNLFDKLDGRGNPLADPMNSYYSLLVASPQMHHKDFGHLYEAIFDQLEEMRRLQLEGGGVSV
ncbi:MAG: hypothetical protein CL605_02440 [Altibacter sp.]|nr:hypothetical protein [Altibacter sp.]|tara:strand:- start:35978 stop:36334 length:357 start_codon:yes stop_codon:yes gene_type:complete